jgi:TonB-linked SusC/RagA family outer membrane protein
MTWAKRLIAAALVLLPVHLSAQQPTGRITGTVTDSSSALPLASASVAVVGTGRGAQTGQDGRYLITDVPAGSYQLQIRRIGFRPITREIVLAAGQTVNVDAQLVPQVVQLSEVVSVGYGTQSRRDVTGSVASAKLEALEDAPVLSIDQMLQGTAAGVSVSTASSEPGGALSVRVRGTSSITGSSEPLYVIDGFPIENDIEGSSVGNGGRDRTTPPNPLTTLNPNDIESISILKDASATAIYGARGANGVVIITTRQGRGTKPQFTLDYYTGMSRVARTYPMLNAREYMDYANEYGLNSSNFYVPFPDTVYQAVLASGVDTDWQDEIFRTGSVRNLQLTVRGTSGGTSVTRYSISGGFFDQDGVVINSGLRRLSARLNVTQSVGQRLEFGANLSGARVQTRSVPTAGQQNANAGTVSAAIQYVPILPVRDATGRYSYIFRDLNAYNSLLDAPATPNPVSLAQEVNDSLGDSRFLGNLYGELQILPGLKLKVSGGADYASRWRFTYFPRTTIRGEQVNGQALRASANTLSWLNENTLTYERDFGSQRMTLLGGWTRQRTDLAGENMSNSNFVSDITGYNDIGSGTQEGGPSISSRRTVQTLESYLARANYALLDRYLATLTVRRDGSSRFAQGQKWGVFPSASFAWRVSSEPWMERVPAIDELKLRLGTGTVGNPAIRPYQSLARLNDQGYSFGGTPYAGYYPVAVGNPNLTWEKTREIDYGVDLGLWERISFVGDYYRRKTTDLLLQVDLPLESGFQSALANVATLQNRGVELGLTADIFKGTEARGFTWNTGLNYARNRNKVLDLGGPDRIFYDVLTTDYNLPGTLIQVGQPIGVFYGYRSLGVVRDSAHAAGIWWTDDDQDAFEPGQMLIADVNGDSTITVADRTIIGDPTPKYTLGWTNTLRFRGVELTGLLHGSFGGKILNINRIRTESSPRVNISRERWLDRWTPYNTDAKFPKIGTNPNQVGTNDVSSNLLEDGSYLRLRTITLAYSLPSRLLDSRGFSAARLYVTGSNLWTNTDYSGYDPDVSSQSVSNGNRGIDIGAYPLAKSVTFGVTFTY